MFSIEPRAREHAGELLSMKFDCRASWFGAFLNVFGRGSGEILKIEGCKEIYMQCMLKETRKRQCIFEGDRRGGC